MGVHHRAAGDGLSGSGVTKGRPRSFDRDEALDAIMHLFCRHGYEGVTLSQLQCALQISKPSLYKCFGNKEQLFRLALDRYEQTSLGLRLAPLEEARSLGEAISILFRNAARVFGDQTAAIGCMILTGTIASHPDNAALVEELVRRREAFVSRLIGRLIRWCDDDRATTLARCLVTTMQGMALQAHDGADAAALTRIAESMALAFTAEEAWRGAVAMARD